MAADIVPELLEAIQTRFKELCQSDSRLQALLVKVENGSVEMLDAMSIAEQVGGNTAKALTELLTAANLPDGILYYNIATRTLEPVLTNSYNISATCTAEAINAGLTKAGLGLKAQTAVADPERIDGIIQRLCAAEKLDDVSWILDEPVKLFCMDAYDQTLKRSADFTAKAGVKTFLVRDAEPRCCKWCSGLDGKWIYPGDAPRDAFRRHDRCRCSVEIVWDKRFSENVHSKTLTEHRGGTGASSYYSEEAKARRREIVRQMDIDARNNRRKREEAHQRAMNRTKR